MEAADVAFGPEDAGLEEEGAALVAFAGGCVNPDIARKALKI
jgi:hypothetical protein